MKNILLHSVLEKKINLPLCVERFFFLSNKSNSEQKKLKKTFFIQHTIYLILIIIIFADTEPSHKPKRVSITIIRKEKAM